MRKQLLAAVMAVTIALSASPAYPAGVNLFELKADYDICVLNESVRYLGARKYDGRIRQVVASKCSRALGKLQKALLRGGASERDVARVLGRVQEAAFTTSAGYIHVFALAD
jgi:hypothetical protein